MDSLVSRGIEGFTLKLRCSCALSTWSAPHVPGSNSEVADLKSASTLEQAEDAPQPCPEVGYLPHPISGLWLRHWERLFSLPIRLISAVVYTTNAIESLNRSLRKVLKTKAHFR